LAAKAETSGESNLKVYLWLLLVLSYITNLHAQEPWVVYARNYHNPYLNEQLQSIAENAPSNFPKMTFAPSKDMEQGRAFAELLKGNIDIFISAPTLKRESQAALVPLPIDRGLLGFRICLTHKDTTAFNYVSSASDIINQKLSFGVASHWPDRSIYESNGLKTVVSPVYETLYDMLNNKRFSCLSRSVNEIQEDYNKHKHLDIVIEERLVLVYPLADFIFVNKKNERLLKAIQASLQTSIDNEAFFNIFNKHYANELLKFDVFGRKLLFLDNNNISSTATEAINQYGITSFLKKPCSLKQVWRCQF